MVQKTAKNHYIPIFYTKRWADTDGKIIEFFRPRLQFKIVNKKKYPSATGYKENIYTLKNLSPDTTTWIEDFLFKILDNKASLSLDYISQNLRADTSDLRCSFGRLLWSLLRRNPEQIIKLRLLWDEAHLGVMDSIEDEYQKLRSPQNPETFEEFKEEYELNSADSGFAYLMYLAMSGDEVISHLINCKWKFIRFSGGFSLLTSDRPVLFHSGALYSDFHVIFAISPDIIFVATNTESEMIRITSNYRILIKYYNDVVSKQAKNYVYGCDISHLNFVEKRLGKGVVQNF
ncbi:DUF4238 domain-containing protein [Gluconobacter kondonii]|uniref:DUF4238 domain-containing protein n=1 Tax=Gluconobacter kondonii TaxID=941463 RepID=UPI001B8D8084|nr:DUF4238 domain-containing protein [Gluconobacter kondonii]MBS1079117.1 DUF4238 domain-containing protein [Gluconobacter kondonii]